MYVFPASDCVVVSFYKLYCEYIFLRLVSAAHIQLKWNDPSNLHTRINMGDTVTWTTLDDEPHTITSTDNTNELNSEVLNTYSSRAFSHTFNKVGYFHYASKANPQDMLGTIYVSRKLYTPHHHHHSQQAN